MGQAPIEHRFKTIPTSVSSAIDLSRHLFHSVSSEIALEALDTIHSKLGSHITYSVSHRDVVVYGTSVRWNRFENGNATVSYPLLPASVIQEWSSTDLSDQPTDQNLRLFLNEEGWQITKLGLLEGNGYLFEVISTLDGDTVYSKDLVKYDKDTNALINIFLPDPLTSSRATYGPPYADNDDQDSPELTAQLVEAEITLTWVEDWDLAILLSEYVEARDIAEPLLLPALYTGPDDPKLRVTRSDSSFEYLNAYYHLNTAAQTYSGLGYPPQFDFPLLYDARGTLADQSSFVPSMIRPYLRFGVGGVDDAEDAEVIVHEFGHAMIDVFASNTNFGAERGALEEGMCDYLAITYSSRITDQNRSTVFDWDGHNEFWDGRTLTDARTYPTDKQDDIYSDGILWASAMAEIATHIGEETCDAIALQSIFGWFPYMLMTDAAQLVIKSDSLLNNGANHDIISSVFCARGMLRGCEDTLITELPVFEPYLGNTFDFAFNNEPLYIYPNRHQLTRLEIVDLKGRLIHEEDLSIEEGILMQWNNQLLPQGTFVLVLYSVEGVFSYKVSKLWN